MATQVTLTLPDELYENAQQWALLTQRDVTQTLTDALKMVLTPVPGQAQREKPIAALSDPEILALVQVRMDLIQGERLGKLLEKQREDRLLPAEQTELLALMQVYNQLWLRQSEALVEAVRRDIIVSAQQDECQTVDALAEIAALAQPIGLNDLTCNFDLYCVQR